MFGNRISLDSCEKMLLQQFENVEFICTGEDDKLCICMIGSALNEETLKEWMSDALRLSPKAITVCSIPQIPRTSSGKVDYGTLKQMALCQK